MLAALIGSQSLVALVSAAPTPKEDFVVNLPNHFVNNHMDNNEFQKGKCLIATDPKNACTDALTLKELEDALDFLGKHKSCKALTTKDRMKFAYWGKEFDNCPMDAYCYVRARQCAELSKANFPRLEYLSELRSYCIKSKAQSSSVRDYTTSQSTITRQSSPAPFSHEFRADFGQPSPSRLQNIVNSRIEIRKAKGKIDNGRVIERTKEYIRIRLEDDAEIRISGKSFANGERIEIEDRNTGTRTNGRVYDERNGEVEIRMDDGKEIWLKVRQ
jgi:hypothetical protein